MLTAILVFNAMLLIALFGIRNFLFICLWIAMLNYFGIFGAVVVWLSIFVLYGILLGIMEFITSVSKKIKNKRPNIIRQQQHKAFAREVAK